MIKVLATTYQPYFLDLYIHVGGLGMCKEDETLGRRIAVAAVQTIVLTLGDSHKWVL